MHGNTLELSAEIMRANNYLNPARIVSRYKAITGCTFHGKPLPQVTMREMVETVVAVDSVAPGHRMAIVDDQLSRRLSE
jgi:hypothetical protein